MSRPLICALDVGTTGVKCTLVDPNHGPVSTAYEEQQLLFPGSDRVEQAASVLETAIWHAIRGALAEQTESAGEIAAVTVTSARASFVGVDDDLEPVGPFIIWQDQRSAEICDRLADSFGADRYYELTGLGLGPVAVASKALWMRQNQPDRWSALSKLLTPQGYALALLGAERTASHSSMAAYYGMLNLESLAWDDDLLNLFEVEAALLPEVVAEPMEVGRTSAQASEQSGLPVGVPLIVAPSDWVCTQIGGGAVGPGQALVYLGTGGALGVYVDQPRLDPHRRLTCLPHVINGSFLVEGLLISAAAIYRWFRDACAGLELDTAGRLKVDTYDLLELQAAQAPVGSHGVMVIPTLMGAGAPLWESEARGMIFGISLGTEKADLIRAIMEGVSFEIAGLLAVVEELEVPLEALTITGPPAGSKLWSQIQADVYGISVRTVYPSDPTLLGAAACAMVYLGLKPDLSSAVESITEQRQVYTPNADHHAKYEQMLKIYQRIGQTFVAEGLHKGLARLRAK